LLLHGVALDHSCGACFTVRHSLRCLLAFSLAVGSLGFSIRFRVWPFGPSAILSQAALVAIPYAHLLERCRAAAAKPSAAGVAEKGVLRGSLIGAAADGLKGQPYRPSLIGLGLGAPNPRGSDGRSAAAPKAQQREGPAGARQVAAPPGTLSKSQVPTANRVAC
jgi:hypothetical protein